LDNLAVLYLLKRLRQCLLKSSNSEKFFCCFSAFPVLQIGQKVAGNPKPFQRESAQATLQFLQQDWS
jgi:hypothetical protein